MKRAVLAVVVLLLVAEGQWTNSTASDSCREKPEQYIYQTSVVSGEYIVQFDEYSALSSHYDTMASFLSGLDKSCHWTLGKRHALASKFPSDFTILQVANSCGDEMESTLISALRGKSGIRSVTPQRMVQRSLKDTSEADGGHGAGSMFGTSQEDDDLAGRRTHFTRRRMHTPFSFDEGANDGTGPTMRRLLKSITDVYDAAEVWRYGFSGKGVKVAVFDTGIRANHAFFAHVEERTNWTDEDTLDDNLGHGTFVAGVIASTEEPCRGFAPDAHIHTFRVFTTKQASFTSWFLDAFNYAIFSKMDVLNLSIGGPDFLDRPFVEKVNEMTANNIIVVSAIGNDGPLYGTLNNPADQSDVIGVGGVTADGRIASFSSRGMTTWELPRGYGRIKPDIVALGASVQGPGIRGGCRGLSGTSVASPVVAGAVTLLASVPPPEERHFKINPASLKQVLVESADRLPGIRMVEQGAGLLNVKKAFQLMLAYEPKASVFPAELDFTAENCPYAWPYCEQPLYHGAKPVIANLTVLNGMGVFGALQSDPVWNPDPGFEGLLEVEFDHARVLWPWTGYLAVFLTVTKEGATHTGRVTGDITFSVLSINDDGQAEALRRTDLRVRVAVDVVPTPPRSKRVLWDQYHSLRYPSGYFPRDNLAIKSDILDWNGDHIHTNFHVVFTFLRDLGYYVEVLGEPFTCFDPTQYGTLLIVDSEEEFFPEEVEALQAAVAAGMSVVVFAEWYNADVMASIKFFDENTKEWWFPAVGGGNVPALNDLLAPFGIALGDKVIAGSFSLPDYNGQIQSGTHIIKWPAGGYVQSHQFADEGGKRLSQDGGGLEAEFLGLAQGRAEGAGRIALFTDANCLDTVHKQRYYCFKMLEDMLLWADKGGEPAATLAGMRKLDEELVVPWGVPPVRAKESLMGLYSRALRYPAPVCGLLEPDHVHHTYVERLQGKGEEIIEFEAEARMSMPRSIPRSSELEDDGMSMVLPIGLFLCGVALLLVVAARWQKEARKGASALPKAIV